MHLVDRNTISKHFEYGGWNIKNLDWFGTALRLKSLWMVLSGEGTWSIIIGHKYLKNTHVHEWIGKQNFHIHGTSYFWNDFIYSLSWIARKLGWKVGDGRYIKLGLDPIAGQSSSFLLSKGLGDYLTAYAFTHLYQIHNLSTNYQSYKLSASNLNLGGIWADQWTDYINGLAHGGI